MTYYPTVVQVISDHDKNIYVYFSDGRITKFDMKPLIKEGTVFEKLQDDAFFSDNLTVMNDSAAWDLSGKHDPTNCIDLDPFVLYDAEQVKDPLENQKIS